MGSSDCELPEPFRSALAAGQAADVCDASCQKPEELYARAMARIVQDRDADARTDLEAALPALGDVCRVELAFLDCRARTRLSQAAKTAREIAEQASPDSRLAARAWHVLGLCEMQRSRDRTAIDALLKARQGYGRLGDRARRAQVLDTLGMVEADRGHLEEALTLFALSLVDKTLVDKTLFEKALGQDRPGMAITLGNLGRVHLRAGRYAEALECFQHDMEICQALKLPRGIGRMHNDLARTFLAMQDYAQAEKHLGDCLELARQEKMSELEFLARKDRALLRIGQARWMEAQAELQAAQLLLGGFEDPYYQALWQAARAELLAQLGDPGAIELLQQAVQTFVEQDLPDLEIPTRIALARELLKQRLKSSAERCLLDGLARARAAGYTRYLVALNEALAGLDLVEGAIEEQSRPLTRGPERTGRGYIVLDRLGGGAFGEVFRVLDEQHEEERALKQLNLQQIYNVRRRDSIIKSARVELEAASRLRHPGVARVYAIGTDPNGGMYIVQEFVRGESLAKQLTQEPAKDGPFVWSCLAQVAYALAALHDAGVIHRDLKPANIILRDNVSPVLIDFGVAHVVGGKDLTSGLVVGTPDYFAPEQAAGKRLDGRADLYALGVIAYQWLCGRLPLQPPNAELSVIARYLAHEPPRDIASLGLKLPLEAGTLVMSLLNKKPRKRPATGHEVGQRMEQLAQMF